MISWLTVIIVSFDKNRRLRISCFVNSRPNLPTALTYLLRLNPGLTVTRNFASHCCIKSVAAACNCGRITEDLQESWYATRHRAGAAVSAVWCLGVHGYFTLSWRRSGSWINNACTERTTSTGCQRAFHIALVVSPASSSAIKTCMAKIGLALIPVKLRGYSG